MISRRHLMRATGIAGLTLGGTNAAQAQVAGSLRELSDLAQLPATPAPVHVPGQGWFEAVADDRPIDGVLRVAGPDGVHWHRMGPQGTLDPAWFAQPDDGPDDALCLARAIAHADAYGPFEIALGAKRYDCRSRLIVDPTTVILRGTGAVLDFAEMPEPPRSESLAALQNIKAAAGWHWQGDALHSDPAGSDALTLPLALPQGGRIRIAVTLGALSGWQDYLAVFVTLATADGAQLGGTTLLAPGQSILEVEDHPAAATLSLRADGAARIDALTVTTHGLQEAILIRATRNSRQYGHKWLEGIEIAGPGGGTALHGLRFQTQAAAMSSRLQLRDVTVRGFQTGLVLSHRAYLIRATNLRIACDVGLHFIGGSRDAGEMITLQDSVIDGGKIAILNDGAEFVLTGSSIDFVDQVVVGTGRVLLQGCHLEVNRPKAANAPLFDIGHGHIDIAGGTFLVTGVDFDRGNQCDHIFALRSRAATAAMREVSIYNLRSQSGALAGGPGRLDVSYLRGRRPRHMAPLVQHRADRNLLGAAPFDLRHSDAPLGPMLPYVAGDDQTVIIGAGTRHLWAVGMAVQGAEVGAYFRVRSQTPGTLIATVQALQRDRRMALGDSWPVSVTSEWSIYRNNTANTHPEAAGDGRMPAGFSNVALWLDMSQMTGPVEIEGIFLCAA
ncbi:hypothetical protein [Loktanella salsilacus]|uniref:hypothetical protein n=1 Tax=Loktanella salsilacus TaxID=195913 RepID=UPI0037350915